MTSRPRFDLTKILTAAFAVTLLAAFGCGSKPPPPPATTPDRAPVQPDTRGPSAEDNTANDIGSEGFEEPMTNEMTDPRGTDEMIDAAAVRRALQPIYFSLDSSTLSDSALRTLEANAAWLRAHPDVGVIVEGHCDERGSTEYNLELGARRARSVRDHLQRLGIDSGRLETISYGEERPVDPGSGEGAWSKNRRVEFQSRDS